jgi:hypothetical protein
MGALPGGDEEGRGGGLPDNGGGGRRREEGEVPPGGERRGEGFPDEEGGGEKRGGEGLLPGEEEGEEEEHVSPEKFFVAELAARTMDERPKEMKEADAVTRNHSGKVTLLDPISDILSFSFLCSFLSKAKKNKPIFLFLLKKYNISFPFFSDELREVLLLFLLFIRRDVVVVRILNGWEG